MYDCIYLWEMYITHPEDRLFTCENTLQQKLRKHKEKGKYRFETMHNDGGLACVLASSALPHMSPRPCTFGVGGVPYLAFGPTYEALIALM